MNHTAAFGCTAYTTCVVFGVEGACVGCGVLPAMKWGGGVLDFQSTAQQRLCLPDRQQLWVLCCLCAVCVVCVLCLCCLVCASRRVSLGFVVALDYRNPYLSPYQEFQNFKRHPLVQQHIKDGSCLQYGARTLNEGEPGEWGLCLSFVHAPGTLGAQGDVPEVWWGLCLCFFHAPGTLGAQGDVPEVWCPHAE